MLTVGCPAPTPSSASRSAAAMTPPSTFVRATEPQGLKTATVDRRGTSSKGHTKGTRITFHERINILNKTQEAGRFLKTLSARQAPMTVARSRTSMGSWDADARDAELGTLGAPSLNSRYQGARVPFPSATGPTAWLKLGDEVRCAKARLGVHGRGSRFHSRQIQQGLRKQCASARKFAQRSSHGGSRLRGSVSRRRRREKCFV